MTPHPLTTLACTPTDTPTSPSTPKCITDKIGLHRVENPSATRKAVSIHVYSPPIRTCEKFDEHTSRHSSVSAMSFDSVDGHLL